MTRPTSATAPPTRLLAVLWICAALSLAGLAGCSSSSSKKNTPAPPPRPCAEFPLELFVQASKKLNLNEMEQPQPVEIRAYLLRDRRAFDALDFETLRRDAEQNLAGDLVKTDTFVVFPGRLEIRPMQSPGQVAYVALVAMFRERSGQRWKLVFDVRQGARRCGKGGLHTMVHARLYKNKIKRVKKQ
jgi:type VI secretion system protein VasD